MVAAEAAAGIDYRGVSAGQRANMARGDSSLERIIRAALPPEDRRRLTVVLPYLNRRQRTLLRLRQARLRLLRDNRVQIGFSPENTDPDWLLAGYHIGFRPLHAHPRYLRFPNWMLHLAWNEIPDLPPYRRFGERLNIDRLMQPIAASYPGDERANRAVMFSSHMREPRRSLFDAAREILGCDGHGRAFGSWLHERKLDIYRGYRFVLCPENTLGDGYVTEKIPDAFYAGCIPITRCRPQDLAIDFNPEAVVNLYGMTPVEIRETLRELRDDESRVQQLRSVPLLLARPDIEPLLEFLRRAMANAR